MNNSFLYVERLLSDRGQLFSDIDNEKNPQALMRAMLMTVFVGAAVFGAVIGNYRGGLQTFYAALKFPLVLLGTAAICAPVLTSLDMALGNKGRWRRDLMLVAAALGTGALYMITLAPLLVLAEVFEVDYHRFILLIALCFSVAGLAALQTLARGLRRFGGGLAGLRTTALIAVFAVVGMQMSWSLRPYVVRLRADHVPFVRSMEGNLMEALVTSLRSAGGHYSRDQAPLPEGS